jgi:hypothetical protein
MSDDLQNPGNRQPSPAQPQVSRHNGLKIFGIVVVASLISTLVALAAVYLYLFPGSFKPVTLSAAEEQALERKLGELEAIRRSPALHSARLTSKPGDSLQPERYSETGASREIILTERELNALLAKNTDLAERLAIDLSQDLASAKLLIPLDQEFPLLGGKTLKVTAGLELAYRGERPVVALKGVSLWGVPVPNAWLGNMKNVDLVREFGDQKGFWRAFAEGIEEIEVREGQLRVRLKE